MTVENSTIKNRIKNLLRSPSIKLRKNKTGNNKECLGNKVTLEKVLGITAAGNRALASDPRSGLVAYPAGCVVVLLNPKKSKQYHILNNSRKTITTLAFSPDGKHVVTGESGHVPAVRVWDVTERTQVAELQEHKYGVACVAFSPNSKYIVSVGYQHDMIVNVWAWKKNVVVAANKVSSKVTAVSFSDDSSYFVTAGNRHVKFWYLDHAKSSKVNATVPLLGRSGLLGELRNNFFSDVACGKGRKADSTFCITSSGLLCEFNDKRLLDKWVELRNSDSITTGLATSLSVTEDLIFCGCADGTVRAFSPVNLHFICTLPRPHCLGSDIAALTEASHLFACKIDTRYPDTVAVSYDSTNRWLSCVYNDHSLYVWDTRDLRKVGKVYSALYHSSCVWSVEMYPQSGEGERSCLTPGSFISCSSDNTIRLWNLDTHGATLNHNVISNDLQKIIYMDNIVTPLLDTDCTTSSSSEKADPQTSENRTGIRTMCISPDRQHLASGDRNGILRIHDLQSLEEILNVQAHDSEILCLEYSKPDTGLRLLATASRDRLIHVLDAEREYSLLQTLDDHSSSITAVRFAANDGEVRMISCGADKSIYFRTAQKTDEGTVFTRTHHVVRKTTLYDMDIDPTCRYAAIGCQDRSIRIFNLSNGKQKKIYKGSQGEDGTLIRVQTDPSGLYVATSCSDKNISIFDFYTGECVATMFGHSEIVTGMKFTNDCKHLISVSGDSCIFVWRLNPELTISMRQRLSDLKQKNRPVQNNPPNKHNTVSTRTEVHSGTMSSDSDKEAEEEEDDEEENLPCLSSCSSTGERTGSSEEKHNSHIIGLRKRCDSSAGCEGSSPRPRRRWSQRVGSMELMVKSMLDLRQLESFAVPPSPCRTPAMDQGPLLTSDLDLGSTISLQPRACWVEGSKEQDSPDVPRGHTRPQFIPLSPHSPDVEGSVLYPDSWEDRVSLASSEFQVREMRLPKGTSCSEKQSPDSACSVDYSTSCLSSPERPGEDSEPTEPLSVDGNSSELDMEDLDEEDEEGVRKSESKALEPPTPDQEAFLKRHFENLTDLSLSVSPPPPPLNSTDSFSISSKFLSQCSADCKEPVAFAETSSAVSEDGSRVACALVSEVHPLVEDRVQTGQQEPQGSEMGSDLRLTPQRKCVVVTDPMAQASRAACAGLRKAQSIHNLSSGADISQTSTRPSKEVSPQPRHYECAPPPSPNCSLPMAPPTNLTSPLPRDPATPTKVKSRSYMSPTASSMAKMSRSVSMGDSLNVGELSDLLGPGAFRQSSDACTPRGSCQSKASSPMVLLSSACAAPAPGSSTPYAAVIPNLLVGSASSPASKGLQGKLTSSTRAPLHLDISKPLPDKPCVASFSPSGRMVKPGQSWSPAGGPARTPPSNPQRSTCAPEQHRLCPRQPEDQAELQRPQEEPELEKTQPRHSARSQHSPERLQPDGGAQDSDCSLSMDSCRLVASELQNCFKKASHCYRMLSSSPVSSREQQEMSHVLMEAFQSVQMELNTLPCPVSGGWSSSSVCSTPLGAGMGVGVSDDRTLALLEQYSQLLLRAVEKRMDSRV
ncbi:mitogen-activated protein kinase-binding protein 1 isoform X1 [Electrophorus electricus]|uniref:mitogen-activated protein kinase-binding protein 1 isoform X1 n=1 Tax=Electrophorus electricus TaxID=8005 RepID=UPI0015D0BC91|nr:mitogen-activated protein kinase-binding protein 1 isoform X1 [Electrophorus electricus]XP_035388496.1 mitogen-activated protein kinase-binding protein 1 isoform X1 [Electrophorus electricus]